jgi:glycosyltransferase involved in cell wall biosynthesis
MIRLLSIQPVAERGGSDQALLRMIRSLPSDGFDCHLVLPGASPLAAEYEAAGATLHVVPMRRISTGHGAGDWAAYAAAWSPAVARIANLVRRLDATLVHSNSLHSWYGWAAAVVTRRPHVWHAREIVVQSRAALRVERVLTRRFATDVIAMSQAIADQLDAPRVHVVRETVDGEEFRPDRAGHFREHAGIPDDAPLVGAAGRLDTWKGFDVFLDAYELARTDRPELRAVVAGGPVAGKEAYAAGLAERAAALEVHWAGLRTDMPDVYPDLDVFALPSTEPEPYGLAAVEALASGTPAIVTASGGAPEILERAPAGSGAVVPAGDAAALARAMVELVPATTSTGLRAARPARQPPSEMDRFAPILRGAVGPDRA